MKNKFNLIAIVVLLIFSVLTGCSSLRTSVATPDETAAPKDTLVISVGEEPDRGFDPTTGWSRYGFPLFQSTLLKMNPDTTVGYDLATDYSVSEDGLVWTVTIRDARFSDGTPVTASDVAFTFNKAKENVGVVDLHFMEKAVAVDDRTVEFRLSQPSSIFIYRLMQLGIVPQNGYSPETYASNPVGSGPYKLESYAKGQKVVAVVNDYYYGEKPKFKKLIILFIDEATRLAMAQAGGLDIIAVPNYATDEAIGGMRLVDVKSVDNRGIMFPVIPNEGKTTESGDPIGNDVTAHLEIRQALNIGLDRASVIDGALNGHGDKAFTVSSYLAWDNGYRVEDGRGEDAKALLEDAGWRLNADGVYEKDGLRAEFDLLYPAGDSVRQAIALVVQKQAQQLGIRINVEGKSWDDIAKRMYSTPVVMGWGSLEPSEVYNLHASSMRGVDWYNPGFYSSELVDAEFQNAITSQAYDEAMVHWRLAQDQISADLPYVWLVNVSHPFLVDSCLNIGEQMVQPHAHGWTLVNNIEDWHWGCK